MTTDPDIEAIDLALEAELAGRMPQGDDATSALARRLHEVLAEMHAEFCARAVAHGVSAEAADALWFEVIAQMLTQGAVVH
jgi:hypothetical protein